MQLVHSLRDDLRRAPLALGGLILTGCFDPAIAHHMVDESSSGAETGHVETTLETTATTTATTADTTASATEPAESSTGTPPECETVDDCPSAEECHVVTCEDGMCVDANVDADTPCGDDTADDCNAADSCDGDGNCVENLAPDGATCTGCPLGQCSCNAGACGDCTFAPNNNFITTHSIEGWELTGGWALYRAAPQNTISGEVVFEGQVLGTDGNRSLPYPGGEIESSYARSAPTTLPATLDFQSWNVDEGNGMPFDAKSVAVTIDDGVTWTVVADCTINPGLAFCISMQDRAPDAWDSISIPLPPEMVGQQGRVEFRYNTSDGCCGFERGWFIDVTNFAGECACGDDAACTPYENECGAGACGATGECELTAVAADTACGDDAAGECTAADTCDGVGYCLTHDQPSGLTVCHDCPSGDNCWFCEEGACNDCVASQPTNDFSFGFATYGWVAESLDGTGNDWRTYSQAPPDREVGSVAIPFPNTPVFGTDGNRVFPYNTMVDPFNMQTENSQVTTSADLVPASITFDSWHVDEGNNVDNKTIQISVDDGATWTNLLDCNTAGDQALYPFCILRSDDRPGDAWDAISIDTAAYAGMVGRLRFTYATLDGCCNFERGWYIDNLNFAQSCNDPQFPVP
jgi:hypothetical protein